MDCVIKNRKNVYLKLNENGRAVTCAEHDKSIFEPSKAQNILSNLPKTLQRLDFQIVEMADTQEKKGNKCLDSASVIIQKDDYIVPDEVKKWIDKFGICDEIVQEARNRKKELVVALSNSDKELSNALHKIELEKSKNAYQGFLEYKKVKSILENRRVIKDELMIISNVLRMDFKSFNNESVIKSVVGLINRKFTLRFTEEDDLDAV